jgi:hypothetical protein
MHSADYRIVARALRNAKAHNLDDEVNGPHEKIAAFFDLTVQLFEAELLADNPRFDSAKFRRAIYSGYSIDTI